MPFPLWPCRRRVAATPTDAWLFCEVAPARKPENNAVLIRICIEESIQRGAGHVVVLVIGGSGGR